ncbi:MAG: hypothetical protein ACTIJ9_09320 [Aequorivita sp.]|uniref:hypothetical protein n=1 Tax=Aequorivita marina TaxID=3073654 RepID=UPI0028761C5E|nr:hypothetical protein [Aequorivita sp. S2608]MDS1299690.1 hypothetical protein [Aequorivita sp. S2608]
MKTFFILSIFSLFLILSCNKEENNPGTGLPAEYNVFLNLRNQDGNSFEEGQIEAKAAFINQEGQIVYNGDWFPLPIAPDQSNSIGQNVFGPFFLSIGWEAGQEPEEGTEWVTNNLLLLRYEGLSEIDTLRGRDSMRYPEYRYFDIFKNGTHLQRFNDPENYIEKPWYITIQK